MVDREQLEHAPERLRQLLGGRHERASVELLSVLREFERVRFDVPEIPDADGFLFQYGPSDGSTFVLSVVRQFEVVDADGEHDGYVQLRLEYGYPADAELVAAGRLGRWWFRGGTEPFDEWLAALRRDPVWRILEARIPLRVDLSQDAV